MWQRCSLITYYSLISQAIMSSTKTLPLPPGKLGLPLLGETIDFLRDKNFSKKRQKLYGNLYKTHLFGRPTVIAIGADANRFLLTNENIYFTSTWPKTTKELLGAASLSIQKGSEHLQRRKLLSQAFQPRALTSYVSGMEAITHDYLQKWEKIGDLTWYPELRKYTFDIACKLLIGTDAASDSEIGELFEKFSEGLFSLPVNLPWTKFGKALHSREQLLMKIEEIILQRQQQTASSQDALGLLLQATDEDGSSLSIQELKDQVLSLLFAGHETLTSAIASFCLLLAQHPDVLAKVRTEQENFDFSQPLTLESLKEMTYLEQVLKEVMRVIPPVGGGFREVIQTCEFNAYQIPQGWAVLYQIRGTHKDVNIYTEPESFDPDRFNPSRAEDKAKPYSYMTFGGGVRECLGKEFAKLEMKVFAALLVRKYQWELINGNKPEMVMVPTPRPLDNLQVRFGCLSR
jgi:retinoid hydroxylase